jgi:hypothetical protein
MEILSELEIDFAFAEGEADPMIAYEALVRGAYVIANDSDFYIFNVPGYISLRSVSVAVSGHLSYSVYTRPKLLDMLGISDAELILAATLMGNDIVDYQRLRRVHTALGFAAQSDLFEIANFIRTQGAYNVLSFIFQASPPPVRDALMGDIQLSCLCYTNPDAFVQHVDIFAFAHPSNRERLQVMYRMGQMSVSLVNLALLRQFWCFPSVGDVSHVNPWDITDSLRMLLYTLVCSRDAETVVVSEFIAVGTRFDVRKRFISSDEGILARLYPPVLAFFRGSELSSLPTPADTFAPFLELLRIHPSVLHGVDASLHMGIVCLHALLSTGLKLKARELSALMSFVLCAHQQRESCSLWRSLLSPRDTLRAQIRFKAQTLVAQWQYVVFVVSMLNSLLTLSSLSMISFL